MRVGVQLPEVERDVRWPEYAAMAAAAEEVGFDSIWLGDHLLYRDGRGERGPWDVWTLLAGLAAVTERVQLGPLVACTAFHRPGMLARMAASVDEISAGRLIAGVGAGWNDVEFRAFGIPFDRRVSRFEEAFEIIRRLLDGEHVTFAGRFYRLDDAVLLPRPASRPPLMVGANGPRMLAATLLHVDAWNTWYTHYGNTPEGFERRNDEISTAAERAGRDPAEIARSACVLVRVEDVPDARDDTAPPVEAALLADHLRALAEAGADEAILVVEPITEASIRSLGRVIAPLRS
jgi:probable F420-dependent oxidoreductase